MKCCWQQEQVSPEQCPYVRPGEEPLRVDRKQRFMRRCLECPRLLEDLHRPAGELTGLVELFPYVVEEVLELRATVKSQQSLLEARAREIKFLHEVSLVLQTSVDMDEVIAMALTAITAGQGFGLNRAILLLVNREQASLGGYFALGPRHRDDAVRIWKELEERDLTLREMARQFFERNMAAERERFSDLLQQLTVPLAERDHLFIQVLDSQLSRHVTHLGQLPGQGAALRDLLGVDELLLVPLLSKNRRIGLLLADNLVSGRPVSAEDQQSLETFALPVAFAIERASLYERLQQELDRAQETNLRLRQQQETIVRMEKMALVGNLAANLAHSIRNPLTIIGGFARALLRDTDEAAPRRQHLESIVREARRLESVLQEALAYSEAQHPTLDRWDVNQLVAGVYAGFREDLELAGIGCRLQLAPDLPLVKLDYKKLGYCLRGLISSTLERVSRDGQLILTTALADSILTITIEDDGPTPSRRELETGTEAIIPEGNDGDRLVFALCARILEGHHARFSVTPRQGGGRVITISLDAPGEETDDTSAAG